MFGPWLVNSSGEPIPAARRWPTAIPAARPVPSTACGPRHRARGRKRHVRTSPTLSGHRHPPHGRGSGVSGRADGRAPSEPPRALPSRGLPELLTTRSSFLRLPALQRALRASRLPAATSPGSHPVRDTCLLSAGAFRCPLPATCKFRGHRTPASLVCCSPHGACRRAGHTWAPRVSAGWMNLCENRTERTHAGQMTRSLSEGVHV